MRSYWLSFCDDARPEGQQFLGVAIVDVTAAEAAAALGVIDHVFPGHDDPGGWIAAAARKAHALGCNPGGQMLSVEVPDPPPAGLSGLPRGRLLHRLELEAGGWV